MSAKEYHDQYKSLKYTGDILLYKRANPNELHKAFITTIETINHLTIEDIKRVSKKLSYNHINAEMDTDENKIINYLELLTELEKLKI